MADLTLDTLGGLPREELEQVLRSEAEKTFATTCQPFETCSKKRNLLLSGLRKFLGLRNKVRIEDRVRLHMQSPVLRNRRAV